MAGKTPLAPASPGVLKRRLFDAARAGDVKALQEALEAGADVHGLDGNKWTALHEACRHHRVETVAALLAAGADPNEPHRGTGFTPMTVATFEPGSAPVVRALLQGGAAPSLASSHGWTALHRAADAGDLEVLEVLLQAGGDPRAVGGPEHQTLLDRIHDAERKRQVEALVARYDGTPKQTVEEAAKAALQTRKPAATVPYADSPPLRLDRLRVKGDPRPVAGAALDRLKSELAARLPAGYEEMMRTLGPGTLRSTVRVAGPATSLHATRVWRERVAAYWFWGEGPLLSRDAARDAVLIADTVAGDELVFLPAAPDTLLLLPREDEEVHLASKTGLLPALARLLASDSGRLPAKLTYEPKADTGGR